LVKGSDPDSGASSTAYRTVVRSARFTAEEWSRVCARAEAAGLSPGRFLRHAALGQSLGRKVEMTALAQLARVGNNLNQVARSLNAGDPTAVVGLEEVLSEVRLAVRGLIRESGS
jgi:hypothetical protein